MGLFEKLFGTRSQRELKKIQPMVDKILGLEEEYKNLSEEALKAKTQEFKDRLSAGETLDDILPEAFATAYLNLFIEGGLKEGNTLLMNAGASGLASVIIPMAKAFGARVITTVLTDDKAEAIAHLGADRVVVTTREDIVEVLREELEAGHGVDVAIDCLGGEIMGKCIHYLTHGARWIMIAALAGQMTEIDLRNIYVRNVRIIGSTLRSRHPAVKAEILAGIVRDVYPKIEAGLVKPTIHAVLPITEAEAAHDILYKGQNVGKVVLTVE